MTTRMTTDLIAAFELVFGVTADRNPSATDDGGIEGPDVDLFVSESEARHRQQGYDNWLENGAA